MSASGKVKTTYQTNKDGIRESLETAFHDADRGYTEHAKIRVQAAQVQATILLADRIDALLAQLNRWDCGDRLAIAQAPGHIENKDEAR